MRTLKYIAIVIGGLLVLLLAAAAIIAATFKPADYKPVLIRLVQEKTQRTLSIPGDIRLSFFPKLGLDLGKLTLSERNGSANFASVEHANVSLAVLPLLSKRVVIDRIAIDGLHATVVRFRDGSTNYDDLLGKQDAGQTSGGSSGSAGNSTANGTRQGGNGTPLAFDIDSIALADADIVYEDRAQGRRAELSKLNLDTGKIADDVRSKLKLDAVLKLDKPALSATVNANTGFLLDLDQKHYQLNGLDIALDGKQATPDHGARALGLRLSAATLDLTPKALKLPAFTADITVKDASLDAGARIAGSLLGDLDRKLLNSPQLELTLSGNQGGHSIGGTLRTPLTLDMQAQRLTLPKIDAAFTLPNPAGGSLQLNAAGNAEARLDAHALSAALKGKLDQSAFDARFGMSSFSPAAYTFDVGIDKLDLDRYRGKPGAAVPAAPQPGAKPAKEATGGAAAPGAEQPIDLSALKGLQAKGDIRIGALTVAGMHASGVRTHLQAAGGRLDVKPLAASLYGGSLAGSLSATAAKPARFTVQQTLSGIDLGPLLKDAIGKQPIEGKGSVKLDVATSGATFTGIKKDLDGSASIALHDGALHGINIAQAVRSAKARLNALRGSSEAQSGTASSNEKTDFSELSASFRIANGVAHNDDLNAKSPLLRVTGNGDINLAEERVDYLVKATVVSTLQGQGGPELQALRGLTIPVKLSGPFAAIDWHVDMAGLASSLAKQKLEERKDELRSKAQGALGNEKQQLQQQLQDKLKGLFGR